uniref:Sleeping Beauty transposase HTH domain-containing protein n=1 Tax=Oryzias latipes TaxID=8090 RepID=A0A3B3HBD5_ORYLA
MVPHGKELFQNLRKETISLNKKGEGYKKISKGLHISQNTIAKVIEKFKKDGSATILQRPLGCPWKLTPRQERLLMRRFEENRHASSLQLVESQTEVTVSHDNIRHALKPLLKPMHKKKACLEFAGAHAEKDEYYWYSVLWSTETKITVFGTNSFKSVWRRKDEDFRKKCLVPIVKRGGGRVMMWGCMSAAGVGGGGGHNMPHTHFDQRILGKFKATLSDT